MTVFLFRLFSAGGGGVVGRSGIVVALQGQQSFQYGRMKGRGKIVAGANQTANIPEGRGYTRLVCQLMPLVT